LTHFAEVKLTHPALFIPLRCWQRSFVRSDPLFGVEPL